MQYFLYLFSVGEKYSINFLEFISIALAWETIICIVMLLPLFLPLSSFGGFIGGYIRRNFCEKINTGVASCFSILPLLIAPIERPIESPTLLYSVRNTIEIQVPADKGWALIPNIDNIQPDELSWNISRFIETPRPLSATTTDLKVGGLRKLDWSAVFTFNK